MGRPLAVRGQPASGQNLPMRGFIGVTDSDWIAHLRATGQTEANFWLPSGPRIFRALQPGQPFLFKTHYPDNRIVGGGFFADSLPLRASEAWECFGQANGVASLAELVARVRQYRRGEVEDNPWIGCVMLDDVLFFDDAVELAPPRSFAKNIVQGKGYELDGPEVDSDAERLFGLLLAGGGTGVVAAGAAGGDGAAGGVAAVPGPVFGDPTVARRRLGQGAFKALVMHSYERRCAITGHKIAPTLQAAHIKPVSRGGENRVDNGLLLRSDVHTMFDRGYLGVDTAHRLRVSPRLRDEFGNGEEFYTREGSVILLPERTLDRPAREFLEWHGDEVFLAG